MNNLSDIERLIAQGQLNEARDLLLAHLGKNDANAYAWFLLGGIYRRKEMWGDAINAYNRAKMLEPQGPAAAAIESIYDILRFVNTDLMNP